MAFRLTSSSTCCSADRLSLIILPSPISFLSSLRQVVQPLHEKAEKAGGGTLHSHHKSIPVCEMVMRTKLNSIWSPEDVARLSRMIDSGHSSFRAAAVFKRSVISVQNQAPILGKPFPTVFARKRALRSTLAVEQLG